MKAPSAAPSKLRNALPPLASNDLFGVWPLERANIFVKTRKFINQLF